MRSALLSMILPFLAGPALAGEISLLGGMGLKNDPYESTSAWQIQYMEGLGDHFAYSLSYLNQGHFRLNHRDCHTANLWAQTRLFDRRLSLAAGLGGLFYYDTVTPDYGDLPQVFHGWGTVTSLAATWYSERPWFYQLQGYRVWGENSFETYSVLAGIGYQLKAPTGPGPEVSTADSHADTTVNELTLFGGETVVNHPYSEHSQSVAIEYRRGLWRYLEWTAGALHEGGSSLTDRYGLTSQLWLAEAFLREQITLGAGLGGYLAVDKRREDFEPWEDDNTFLNGIASMSVAIRLNQDWIVRVIWDRVIADYDRDSDVFLVGIGYRLSSRQD